MSIRFSMLLFAAVAASSVSVRSQAQSVPPESGRVSGLPTIRNYRTARVASADRAGNADAIRLAANETTVIAELAGPGEITHLWTTIATGDGNHLRNIVLRIYWDGNKFPSVEAPIGDFYGLGNAKYYYLSNPVQAIGTVKGMNAFWPMPFAKSARVEITNESAIPVGAFYYYVDWRRFDTPPEGAGYFHAQYRQAFPNEPGKSYLILDTDGAPGHYVGVSLSIHTQVSGWWGEGDDKFTIDGEAEPSIWGTGSEDYFCGAWGFGDTFYTDYFGMPLRERKDQAADNWWNVYRLHLENPVTFRKSLKVEIEHGAFGFDENRSGRRNNDYSSVAYWYMEKPVPLKGTLPPAADRISAYRKPREYAGVYEAQSMTRRVPDECKADAQDMSLFGLSGGKWLNDDQLFCNKAGTGSRVKLTFETTGSVNVNAVLAFTKAPDYGRIQVSLGKKMLVADLDCFAPKVVSDVVPLGEIRLPRGKHTLTVTVTGKNPKATDTKWGIDYLRIGGTPTPVESAATVMQSPGKR